MAHWLKPRPLLVLALLFVTPAAAIAHLLITWAPAAYGVYRLAESVEQNQAAFERQAAELERAQQELAHLRELAAEAERNRGWLPRRDHHRVSNLLGQALQGDGVVLERLAFDEPVLYAAAPDAGVLACEEVTAVCRGPYAGLVARLDALDHLGVPVRVTYASWKRAEHDVELELELQVPFVPEGELAQRLSEEAGLEEAEDEI